MSLLDAHCGNFQQVGAPACAAVGPRQHHQAACAQTQPRFQSHAGVGSLLLPHCSCNGRVHPTADLFLQCVKGDVQGMQALCAEAPLGCCAVAACRLLPCVAPGDAVHLAEGEPAQLRHSARHAVQLRSRGRVRRHCCSSSHHVPPDARGWHGPAIGRQHGALGTQPVSRQPGWPRRPHILLTAPLIETTVRFLLSDRAGLFTHPHWVQGLFQGGKG